jgi:hypothetical protein
MHWYDFVALILGTIALMRAWFEGSIFIVAREYAKARGGLLGDLANCKLCLTFHVAFALAVPCIILPYWLPASLGSALRDVLYVLAAVSLVHLYWDWFGPTEATWNPPPVPASFTSRSSECSEPPLTLPFNASQNRS